MTVLELRRGTGKGELEPRRVGEGEEARRVKGEMGIIAKEKEYTTECSKEVVYCMHDTRQETGRC